jgi:hypothetical protein
MPIVLITSFIMYIWVVYRPLYYCPRSPRDRPLKLGKYDSEVCEYLLNLRAAGGIVNYRIAIAAAKGIIMSTEKHISWRMTIGSNRNTSPS